MTDDRWQSSIPTFCALLAWTALGGLAFPPAAAGQSARDSAGVRIIENATPSLAGARTWRVDPRPVLTIGGPNPLASAASPDYEFALVMGAARLADGRYVVAVQGSHHLRFFDAVGRFVGAAGRSGQGPGEFRQILGMGLARGDTIVVTDLGEVEYFSAAGKFARTGASRAKGSDVGFIYPQAVLTDGSYVGFDLNDQSIPPAGRRIRRQRLLRVSADGMRNDTIALVPTADATFDGRQPYGARVVHAPRPLLAVRGTSMLYSFPANYEITEYGPNRRIVRSIRRAWTPTRVSAEHRETYLAHARAIPGEDGRPMGAEMKAYMEQQLAKAVYAATMPALAELLVDRAGNLWAQHYDPEWILFTPGPVRTRVLRVPTRWDVFDPLGTWLTTVDLPARFTPLDIGSDFVLGLSHDEDELESLTVLRLRKP